MVNKNLIGCCGIYCGACPFYRSDIPELAKKLKEGLKKEKFDKIAVPLIGLAITENLKSG